jgi:signal transduction histidine kinase
MSIRQKMRLEIAGMIVGLLVVSTAGIWGLDGVRDDYGLVLQGFHQLRQSYDIGAHLGTAQAVLQPRHVNRAVALAEVKEAAYLSELMRKGIDEGTLARPVLPTNLESISALQASLSRAQLQLAKPAEDLDAVSADARLAEDERTVGDAIGRMRTLSAHIRNSITMHHMAADAKQHTTMIVLMIVCGVVLIGISVLGMVQYRGVVWPVRQISRSVRKIAAGQFAERIPELGSEEFVSLAQDFNRMAADLDLFYHRLEEAVAQKSKELVLSERLAGIGYLAAGVAHEINNPLGIIAGYAEYSLADLKRQSADHQDREPAPALAETIKSLQIICDESFRCKGITSKLLSLARRGEETRQPVCLADLADQVISIIGGLKDYRERKLIVSAAHVAGRGTSAADDRADLTVLAVEAEMKQVLLNLTVNALEATPSEGGEVRIDFARDNGSVQVMVSDNGRGMAPETLERIFEPFFTDKRGSRQAGTGLGLSITHRIIESHGGTISAYSHGPGTGTRFVILLPAHNVREEATV